MKQEEKARVMRLRHRNGNRPARMPIPMQIRRKAMSRKRMMCICAGLTVIIVVGALVSMSTQVPPDAIVMRQRFPYISLDDRLAFEARRPDGDSSTSPKL